MEVVILSGIPCSGKSTYRADLIRFDPRFVPLCRDDLRIELFGKNYKQNSRDEKKVTAVFLERLQEHIKNGDKLIIDQTNCKQSYINELLTWFPSYYIRRIKYFPIPLWKAYYRNVIRWWKTGKFIPFKVIKAMKVNFDKIKK